RIARASSPFAPFRLRHQLGFTQPVIPDQAIMPPAGVVEGEGRPRAVLRGPMRAPSDCDFDAGSCVLAIHRDRWIRTSPCTHSGGDAHPADRRNQSVRAGRTPSCWSTPITALRTLRTITATITILRGSEV